MASLCAPLKLTDAFFSQCQPSLRSRQFNRRIGGGMYSAVANAMQLVFKDFFAKNTSWVCFPALGPLDYLVPLEIS